MNSNVNDTENGPRRRRRTAAVARREILDAAKKRLMEGGPDNVRLKLIGEDVGLSHSSILHHFGSRDGLMEALRSDAFSSLGKDLAKRMAKPPIGDPTIDFFNKVAETLGNQGYGRLLAWQLMSGFEPENAQIGKTVLGPDGSGGLLGGLATQLQALRAERAARFEQPVPDEEETRMIVATFASTMLGEALAGHLMARSAGLGNEPEDRRRIREWFAKQAEAMVFAPYPKPESFGESQPTTKTVVVPTPREKPLDTSEAAAESAPRSAFTAASESE